MIIGKQNIKLRRGRRIVELKKITWNEIETAFRILKVERPPGVGGIWAEMLNYGGELTVNTV